MKKEKLKTLIYELTSKKERLEDEYKDYRDNMKEVEGAIGELEVMIYKLEEFK